MYIDTLISYSQDPGDLDIKAGDRILVTERSSVDWYGCKLVALLTF